MMESDSELNKETQTKIAIIVEYEGTRYHGFQAQGKLPTIQVELENALEKLTGARLRVLGASRTDAGVHAKGQIVCFRTEFKRTLETIVKGLNHYLPEDISVKAAYRIPDSFDVRRRAVSREYRYYILNSAERSPLNRRFSYRAYGALDVEAMNDAAQALLGEHDFASFVGNAEAAAKNTVRMVFTSEVRRDGEKIVFRIVANAFLMHQVRNLVGSLLKVGKGMMSVKEFCSILEAKQPGLAIPTAAARGLCLIRVNYKTQFGEGEV